MRLIKELKDENSRWLESNDDRNDAPSAASTIQVVFFMLPAELTLFVYIDLSGGYLTLKGLL